MKSTFETTIDRITAAAPVALVAYMARLAVAPHVSHEGLLAIDLFGLALCSVAALFWMQTLPRGWLRNLVLWSAIGTLGIVFLSLFRVFPTAATFACGYLVAMSHVLSASR